ncbi:alkaline phosphatase-like protein [Aureobasidium pullulans]|nr:alkaline phosphatase-like protein [Aureobasidium pullulans]
MMTLKGMALGLSNLLIPLAVLVFATGFFPYKPFLSGLATFEEVENEELGMGLLQGNDRPQRIFDKVIFMTVDALRSDFVYGHESGFNFTQSLIALGAAVPFTAHATPPTITMPRVKALTSGSVPSFLDVILNFAESDTSSSLATQDTWLAQAKANLDNGNLVFYGDDTWLKLFPDFFARHDGTSSFFVSDFTEVDNNVTRHVPRELNLPDWDVMIMHYLGLDHIGHKAGPLSPNMLPKQKEMDNIVKEIYEAMELNYHLEDTLLVVAGDHGMNSAGNHGGSAPGETEPALVFISPKFMHLKKPIYTAPTNPNQRTEFEFYRKVAQNDVVPTLSALLGIPVPRNNLGILLPEMLAFWESKFSGTGLNVAAELLYRNALQMLAIIKAKFGDSDAWAYDPRTQGSVQMDCHGLEDEKRLTCRWLLVRDALSRSMQPGELVASVVFLNQFLNDAQDVLSTTASSYNVDRLIIGAAISAISLALATYSKKDVWSLTPAGISFTLITALYGIMMFATSYVEEEQHFWYWTTAAWMAYLYAAKTKATGLKSSVVFSAFVLLALHRLSTRWNQTGQKHAGDSDVAHAFFPNHHIVLWMLVITAYIQLAFRIGRRTFADILAPEFATISAISLVLPSFVFKLNFTQADAPELVGGLAESIRQWTSELDLVMQARTAFVGLGIATLVVIIMVFMGYGRDEEVVKSGTNRLAGSRLPSRLHDLLTLLLITQTRAQNIPLFMFFDLQSQILFHLLSRPTTPVRAQSHIYTRPLSILQTTITVLLMAHTSFFALGNSNAISSIDLSNAYNGVSGYNVVAVGVLLFASNWAGPIYWSTCAAVLFTLPSIEQEEATLDRLEKAAERQQALGRKKWIYEERDLLHQQAVSAYSASAPGDRDDEGQIWHEHISVLTMFVSASLVAVMIACTLLRTEGLRQLGEAGVKMVCSSSPLNIGLLRAQGVPIGRLGDWHPAPSDLRLAVSKAADLVSEKGDDLASLALRFAVREIARKEKGLPAMALIMGPGSLAEVESCAAAAKSVRDQNAQGKFGDLRDETVLDEEGVQSDEPLVQGVREILGRWIDFSFESPPKGWDVEAGKMGKVE